MPTIRSCLVCCCRRACGKWLPENHLAYVVSDVIDQLDLWAMDQVYGSEKHSQPPYDPRMRPKLLGYGYCVGVFSSRRITLLRGGVSARSGDRSHRIRFRLRQQIFDLRTEVPSSLFIRSLLIAFVLAGIGLIFVPPSATRPTFNARASSAIFRASSKSRSIVSNGSCRKSVGGSADYPPPAPGRQYLPLWCSPIHAAMKLRHGWGTHNSGGAG